MFSPQERSHSVISCCFFIVIALFPGLSNAAPSIRLATKSGPPTSRILVSGAGFAPNVGVDIYFDTKDEALVVSNGKGEFNYARIDVPRSASPGEHWVTALERNNDKGAQQPFLVQTNWTQLRFAAEGTLLNPFENRLGVGNVGSLNLKWSFAAGGLISSSPTVVNGVVYAGSNDNTLYALNAGTGKMLWSFTAGNSVSTSPTVVGGMVYFGSWDNHVYALNASTGALAWNFTSGGHVLSTPTVFGGVLYFGSWDNHVYALNAKTGAKLWSYDTGEYVSSSPAIANGVVYVGSWNGNVYALAAETGSKLWFFPTRNSVITSPVVANDVVYIGSEDYNVYALDAATGALRWSYSTGDPVFTGPAVADGVVYVGVGDSPNGGIYALNADMGTLLWSYPASYGIGLGSPTVANGVVYVGILPGAEEGVMFAFDAITGGPLWTYEAPAGCCSSAVVVNGDLYMGDDEGNVYAFGLFEDTKEEQETLPPEPKALRPNVNLKVFQPPPRLSRH